MKKSFSESVAAEMNDRLQSEAHLSLFNNVYKFASEKCEVCGKSPCECDSMSAKDRSSSYSGSSSSSSSSSDSNDARTKQKEKCEVCGKSPCECDSMSAKDSSDDTDTSDSSDADDFITTALDEAFSHLLSASAALDTIGFEKSSAHSLNLAGFIVEAKKKVKNKKKDKAKSKSSKKDSKTSKMSKKDFLKEKSDKSKASSKSK